MSIGAPRRPALLISHPSASRETEMRSEPIGTERTKMVKLDAGASPKPGSCADEGAATASDSTISAARVQLIERMPQHSTTILPYDAARQSAALVDRTGDRGRIVLAGPDRATYLQGLVTNDVVALAAGRGCYAAMLTPQGRMIADLWVYELGDVMMLAVVRAVKDTLLAKLDQFIFSENVQLGD